MRALKNLLGCVVLVALLAVTPAPAAEEGRPSPSPERVKAYQQLRELKQKAEQLEKDGKHDEAERARHEAKELMAKLSPKGAERGPGGAPSLSPEQQKMQARFRELRIKAAELDKQGKHDEAEAVRREGKELMAKSAPHGREGAAYPMRGPSPEREKLRARVRELEEKAKQLRKEGKYEDFMRARREAEQLTNRERAYEILDLTQRRIEQFEKERLDERSQRILSVLRSEAERARREAEGLEPKPRSSDSERGPGGPPAELEAKLRHMHVAAENLRAAGLADQADNVVRMMERMKAAARPPERREPPAGSARELAELRQQLEHMRREMQEMREQLKRSQAQGERK